jgi:plasmid stabilization system protein ParE
MGYKAFLSAEALNDLEGTVFCKSMCNAPETGAREANQLLDEACLLGSAPNRGCVRRRFRVEELREFYFGDTHIVYRVNAADQSVEIVRFLMVLSRLLGPPPPPPTGESLS